MVTIPLYRANKIGSNEYVKGYFWKSPEDERYFIISICDLTGTFVHIHIDPSTLAIHFSNMIDKNGKKIFASLSEDGVGGDILSNSFRDGFNTTSVVIMVNGQIHLKTKGGGCRPYNDNCGWCSINEKRYGGIEVIGIHKG